MRGVSTAFWSIVLVGSTMAIAAGFVGGRSIGSAGALPVAEGNASDDGLPAPIRQVRRRSGTQVAQREGRWQQPLPVN